jgi:transposase
MELYGGIDLHSNNNVIVLTDEQDQMVLRRRLPNDLGRILEELAPDHKDINGLVVESTYNWYWLVDGLIEAGFSVHLANTAGIVQYKGLKYTDDNSDARFLATLLRLGLLPVGYIYPKEQRAIRDLLRKRGQLVRQRTANLLSVQNILTRNLGKSYSANDVKKLTLELVEQLLPDQNISLAVESNLMVMGTLSEAITQIEKIVKRQVRPYSEYQGLIDVSGIGPVLGLTITLETGDIKRFAKVGNYASYCRCVGSKRISNGKTKGRGNTKNGNKYLAWAYMEAANFAVRYNPHIKRYYQRKKAKTNGIIAIKTVAHKLARGCYYVLRDRVEFDVKRVFA